MSVKMIDYVRYTLYAALIFITMLLFQAWQKEHQSVSMTTPAISSQAIQTNDQIPPVPQTANNASSSPTGTPLPTLSPTPTSSLVHITTDVLEADIDTAGGNIVQVKLLKYPEALHSKTAFSFLNNNPSTRYVAQSGLLSATGPDTQKGQVVYTTDKKEYTLDAAQNSLQVNLHWQEQGINVTKTFTFQRDNYEINVNYHVDNQSSNPWEGNLYTQIMRTNTPPATNNGLISLATYFGAAVSSHDKPFQKINFKQMQTAPFSQTISGGWAAMVQHYFVSAWIPDKTMPYQYFSRVTRDNLYTIGMMGPTLSASPNTVVDTQAKFYAGPAIADRLEQAAPGLQLTIDYGWFWFIAVAIFWMMQKIHSLVGNWGWSIVLVTIVIKLMFYHLSAKSYRSMSVLKNLQPKINQLKERFGDDKQKFTQAMLEIYKKEKVNPMSGCLPILIQIPVFIGLYWVLIESVELRQAPFILWIHDLTQKDPFYILPLLMGLSMFLQQRLNPPPPDPMQAKMMMFLPVIFTAMFLNFPAGLMLYWFVNNSLSFLQQWYIMHTINKETALKVKKK